MAGKRKWYDDFFRDGFYLRHWATGPRDERAAAEVDFILSALELAPGGTVLDLCCGEGRHTLELARRGYRMTGLDLAALHLREARRRADAEDLQVRWLRADMRDIPWESEFDAVICMFTSFGVLEGDEEDMKVLRAVAKTLRPGGRFLLDTINREMLMRRWEARGWQQAADGSLILEERRMDFLTGRQHNRVLLIRPDGGRQEKEIDLRLYTLKELSEMLARAGMKVGRTWGGFDGRDYGMSTLRMIVLGEKRAGKGKLPES